MNVIFFPVSSILRTDGTTSKPEKRVKPDDETKTTSTKLEQSNSSGFYSTGTSAQSTPLIAPIPQRVPFQQQQQQMALPLARAPVGQQCFNLPARLPLPPQQQQQFPANFPPQLPPLAMMSPQWLLANPGAMFALLQHQQQLAAQQQQQMLMQAGEFCVVCGDRASGHHYGVGNGGFYVFSNANFDKFRCKVVKAVK